MPPLRVGALAGAEMETRFLDPDDDIVFDLNLLRYYFANSPVASFSVFFVNCICCMITSCVQKQYCCLNDCLFQFIRTIISRSLALWCTK